MRKGLDQREVESLAKTMEVKFTVSRPHIGGAKVASISTYRSNAKKGSRTMVQGSDPTAQALLRHGGRPQRR